MYQIKQERFESVKPQSSYSIRMRDLCHDARKLLRLYACGHFSMFGTSLLYEFVERNTRPHPRGIGEAKVSVWQPS